MSDEGLIAGRYRRVASLGRGAVGEVWLADDTVLRRQVAIKSLRVDLGTASDSVALDRIVREAQIAAGLRHRNVVAVYDLVTDGGQPYVVMEFIDGESLAQVLSREKRIAPGEAARLVGQVAGALALAHKDEIIHRDIKPGNIMIDSDGQARLADFGIARVVRESSLTHTGELIGTVAFMAPECARGEPATAASDVWSLGATFYAAVAGHPPHEPDGALNVLQLIHRLTTVEVTSAPAAADYEPLVLRMLASDPAARPTAATVVRSLAQLRSKHASDEAEPLVPRRRVIPPTPSTRYDESPTTKTTVQREPEHRPAPVYAQPQPRRPRRGVEALSALLVVLVVAAAYVIVKEVSKSPSFPAPTKLITTIPVGVNPKPPVLSNDGSTLYVASGAGYSGQVQVISTSDDKSVAIRLGTSPGEIQLSHDNKWLFVPEPEKDRVAIINTQTRAIRTAPVGDGPEQVVVSPSDKTLYVANWDVGRGVSITVLRLPSGHFLRRISVPAGPRMLPNSVSSADGEVYVASYGRGVGTTVTPIGAGTARSTPITVGAGPRAVFVTPDGRLLVVPNYGVNGNGDTVSVVRLTHPGKAMSVTVGGGPKTLTASADSALVYVADNGVGGSGDAVSVISTSAPYATKTVTVGPGPQNPELSPDGRYVYVPCFGSEGEGTTIAVISTETNKVVKRFAAGSGPRAATFSPNGQRLYVTEGGEGDAGRLAVFGR